MIGQFLLRLVIPAGTLPREVRLRTFYQFSSFVKYRTIPTANLHFLRVLILCLFTRKPFDISSGVSFPSLPVQPFCEMPKPKRGCLAPSALSPKVVIWHPAGQVLQKAHQVPLKVPEATSSEGKRRPSSISERKGAVILVRLASSRKDKSNYVPCFFDFFARDCACVSLQCHGFRGAVKRTLEQRPLDNPHSHVTPPRLRVEHIRSIRTGSMQRGSSSLGCSPNR